VRDAAGKHARGGGTNARRNTWQAVEQFGVPLCHNALFCLSN
jgi:hypothetical protein